MSVPEQKGHRREVILAALKEFKNSDSVQKYVADSVFELLEHDLSGILERVLHAEFVRGYERGKSDEKDAKEIDKSLEDLLLDDGQEPTPKQLKKWERAVEQWASAHPGEIMRAEREEAERQAEAGNG